MSKAKVFFISGQKEWVAEILKECMPSEGFELEWRPYDAPEEEKLPFVQEAEYIVLHPADISENLLRNAKKLKLLQLLTAGYDKINLDLCKELGVPVATNGGANSWAVAEHAVTLILALYKHIVHCDRSVREGQWRKGIAGLTIHEITGKTVGLIGAGNIGRKVAKRLAAFEAKIIYYDVVPSEEIERELGARRVELDDLLREADIVTLHIPSTPQTRGLINRERLALMKPTAILINTSRGAVVDEDALVEALREKRIFGAGLDVFLEEPLPAGHPLTKLDNVVLSPHIGGHSYEGWYHRSRFAWQNIQRVAAGQEPLSLARPEG